MTKTHEIEGVSDNGQPSPPQPGERSDEPQHPRIRLAEHSVDASGYGALERLVAQIDGAELTEREAYRRAAGWAAKLPSLLVAAVLNFVRYRTSDALVVRGLPLGRIELEPTSQGHGTVRPVSGFEGLCLAVSTLTGSPIGYSTQQGGRLVNDIVPIEEGAAIANFSGGFTNRFEFHTEDAFLHHPPDFIQLGCVRNPTSTPLTVSGVYQGDLDSKTGEELREPQYVVGVNPGQQAWAAYAAGGTAVLSGPADLPWIRFNQAETSALVDDLSLHLLSRVLERNALDIPLLGGDLVIVDNARLAHSRASYTARCDGTDRWLLRLVAYRNLHDAAGGNAADPEFPILTPPASS